MLLVHVGDWQSGVSQRGSGTGRLGKARASKGEQLQFDQKKKPACTRLRTVPFFPDWTILCVFFHLFFCSKISKVFSALQMSCWGSDFSAVQESE